MEKTEKKRETVRLPQKFIYGTVLKLVKPVFSAKYKISVKKEDMQGIKPPYVVVANHLSRIDWVLVAMAFWPDTLNVVVTRYYYSNPKLRSLLKLMGAIPKDQFSPDLAAVRNIMSVTKRGGVVMLFPEGRTAPHGVSETFEFSTIKLLKHLNVPVVYMHHSGSYLTNPKWANDYRKGKIELTVKPLFTAEELKSLTEQQAFAKMCTALKSDEFEWQRKNNVRFKCKAPAKGLDGILYKCPRCGAECKTVTDEHSIKCEQCGNGAFVDEYYRFTPFDDSCVIPQDISRWFLLQKQSEQQAVCDESFELRCRCVLRELAENSSGLTPVGEGELLLNKQGLFYSGTRCGESFELAVPIAVLSAMPFVPNTSFEVYYGGVGYSFLPENGRCAQKWSIAAEQLHIKYAGSKNIPVYEE